MVAEVDNFIHTQPLFWENRTISDPVIPELRRRSNAINRGQEYRKFDIFSYENTYESYKGHMVPWIRVFSNGTGIQKNSRVPVSDFLKKQGKVISYDGFILSGGKDFDSSYGFSKGNNNQAILSSGRTILGYEANGNPHYIDPIYKNSYSYTSQTSLRSEYAQNNSVPAVLPAPGIESFNVRVMKDHVLTETKFKFKCYTLAQLEYMIPFFLTPGVTIFAEFGWNVFNYNSLLDSTDLSPANLYDIVKHPWKMTKRVYDSRGNYGITHGLVTDYNFSTEDNYLYECNVTVLSPQNFYENSRIDHDLTKYTSDTSTNSNVIKSKYIMNFKSFLRQKIPFLTAITNGIGSEGPSNFVEFFQKFSPISKDEVVATKINNFNIGSFVPNSFIPTTTYTQYTSANGQRAIKTDTGEYVEKRKVYDATLKNIFYDGKIEDRVFTSRNTNNIQISDGAIEVNKFTSDSPNEGEAGLYTSPIYFNSDKNIDFDVSGGKDGNESKLWLTLGLLVDIINYKNSGFNVKINIDDVIINAHPNLISCDPDVLIPNPVAPKINHGRLKGVGGFLEELDQDNKFNFQLINWEFGNKKTLNYAFNIAHNFFKTYVKFDRQDLDSLINYKRYKFGSRDVPSIKSKEERFRIYGIPFATDVTIGENTYSRYRYGYLKNIFISDTFILQLTNDDTIKTFSDFVNAVLKKINESVGGYWEFEMVYDDQTSDDKTSGNYTIVDKGLNNIKKIYQFELGGDKNVIKSINFDVKLSNEQASQILFSTGNNSDNDDNVSINTSGQDPEYKLHVRQKSLPSVSYIDRFDIFRKKERDEENDKLDVISDVDTEIQQLQTYGNVSKFFNKNNFLMVTGKSNLNDKIYYHLNLPSNFKNKLSQILDDGDHKNNIATYSNIADNFLITLVLDGNYGFKPLQVFSISNLPKPYVSGNCLFQIFEVNHAISNGKWETEITAMLKGDYPNKDIIFEKI